MSISLQTEGNGRVLENGIRLLLCGLVCGWQCVDIWGSFISRRCSKLVQVLSGGSSHFLFSNLPVIVAHPVLEILLCRLCIVFLVISCIGYAMPFILCATICCCLPCIISVLGLREDLTQTRGATPESINALPTYKFKLKKSRTSSDRDSAGDGGVVAAGTDKERAISGEDAVSVL